MPKVPSSRRRGFTLVEIAIAVTIIAVLASVTLMGIRNVRANAEYQQCLGNLENLKLTMDRYKANNEFHPAQLSQAVDQAYGMRTLPRCPSAPPTYTGLTYGMVPASGFEGYEFVLYCNGYHQNKSIAAGYPQYNSATQKMSP